jgi:hypothetical protein
MVIPRSYGPEFWTLMKEEMSTTERAKLGIHTDVTIY